MQTERKMRHKTETDEARQIERDREEIERDKEIEIKR